MCCLDAWLCDDGASCRGDAAAGRVRALFDAYRGSLCAAVSGCVHIHVHAMPRMTAKVSLIQPWRDSVCRCVPGWAYRDGRASMELREPDLMAAASLQVQEQLYHVSTQQTRHLSSSSIQNV